MSTCRGSLSIFTARANAATAQNRPPRAYAKPLAGPLHPDILRSVSVCSRTLPGHDHTQRVDANSRAWAATSAVGQAGAKSPPTLEVRSTRCGCVQSVIPMSGPRPVVHFQWCRVRSRIVSHRSLRSIAGPLTYFIATNSCRRYVTDDDGSRHGRTLQLVHGGRGFSSSTDAQHRGERIPQQRSGRNAQWHNRSRRSASAVGSQSAWRMAMPLPASLQNSHKMTEAFFSSSWRILEPYVCADIASEAWTHPLAHHLACC